MPDLDFALSIFSLSIPFALCLLLYALSWDLVPNHFEPGLLNSLPHSKQGPCRLYHQRSGVGANEISLVRFSAHPQFYVWLPFLTCVALYEASH